MSKRSPAGGASDPTIEFAPLEIDGVTYQLAYDFAAIAEADKLTGAHLLTGMGRLLLCAKADSNGVSREQYTALYTAPQLLGLLYAALRIAQPKMTIADAARLCRIDTFVPIEEALLKSWNASLPEASKILKGPTGDAPIADASIS